MFELKIHSDDDEIRTICELYWEMDYDYEFVHKVSEIAELVEINKTKILPIVRENSTAIHPDWKCEDCSKPYIFSSRTDFLGKKDNLIDPPKFRCERCQKLRREKEIEIRRKKQEEERKLQEIKDKELKQNIRQKYSLENRPNTDVSLLSFKKIIYLISIIRAGAFESMTKIIPMAMFDQALSPTIDFSLAIVSYLHNHSLIYIHPDTEPEAFVDESLDRFYIWRVYYAPPISHKHVDDKNFIIRESLRRINEEWSDDWNFQAYQLWKKIAKEECLEYLVYVLNEHHFEFSPGEKTNQYINYALDYFSTAQVFNIIWRSAKDAAAYYQRESISKRQAANSAVSAIQRYSERAISEGWDIKPYSRNFNCPQSVVSEVLYNSALRFGDNGFRLIPNIEAVENKDLPDKKQSQYTIYDSHELVEKWNFDPDIVFGEYGSEKPASEAQLKFIQSLADQFPNEAEELTSVINSTSQNTPFSFGNCTNGLAKFIIKSFLSLQESDNE